MNVAIESPTLLESVSSLLTELLASAGAEMIQYRTKTTPTRPTSLPAFTVHPRPVGAGPRWALVAPSVYRTVGG